MFTCNFSLPIGQLRARASPTITTDPAPTTSAAPPPPPAPASTCTDTSGRISVKSADGQMDGYISAALSSFGEYGLTSDTDAALIVNTCVFPDGTYELRSLVSGEIMFSKVVVSLTFLFVLSRMVLHRSLSSVQSWVPI